MKKFTLLSLSGLLMSGVAVADQFSASVNVNRRTTELTVIQQKALTLPEVNIDATANNGDILCDTTGANAFANSNYCSGPRANGIYKMVGKPSSSVSIQLPPGAIISNGIGLRLSIKDGNAHSRVLGNDGTLTFEVIGQLSLENKSQVDSVNQVFDFELTAVYN